MLDGVPGCCLGVQLGLHALPGYSHTKGGVDSGPFSAEGDFQQCSQFRAAAEAFPVSPKVLCDGKSPKNLFLS